MFLTIYTTYIYNYIYMYGEYFYSIFVGGK